MGKATNPRDGSRPRERDATLHHRYYPNYRNKRQGAKRGNPAKTGGSVKRRKRPRRCNPDKSHNIVAGGEKGAHTTLGKKICASKRYGIDLVTEEKEEPEKEVN